MRDIGQEACFQTQDRSLGKGMGDTHPTETKAVPEKKSGGTIALRHERNVSERAYSSEWWTRALQSEGHASCQWEVRSRWYVHAPNRIA